MKSVKAFVRGNVDKAKEVVGRYETDNPHTAGQVRATVGAVLLADGLVGLEDPLDNKKSRPGILGAAFMLLFSIPFIAVGFFIAGGDADTDASTTGTLTYVSEPRRSSGDSGRTCSAEATFVVDGTTYTARTSVSSSGLCDEQVGEPIKVRYNSANPAENSIGVSQMLFGAIFGGVGALIFLIALVTFAVRAASVFFGYRLLRSGRQMMRDHPKTSDDAGAIAEARTAMVNLVKGRTAHASGGSGFNDIRGSGSGLLAGLLGPDLAKAATPDVPAAPSPVGPAVASIAPGWYPTADGAHVRWHDGTGWTEHTQPAPAPQAPS